MDDEFYDCIQSSLIRLDYSYNVNKFKCLNFAIFSISRIKNYFFLN